MFQHSIMAFYQLHNYVIPIVNISFVYLIILRLTQSSIC